MRYLLLTALMFLTIGCQSKTETDEATEEDTATVFDDQVQTIDKAKQVEQQVLDQKKKVDDALEQADGG